MGCANFAGIHLEGDEHTDGEVAAVHHGIGADDQDEQGHHLFEAVGDDVVGVAILAHVKTGAQVFGQIVAVAGTELGFHLQALDGFQTGYVFGGKRLVARAQHELFVQTRPEQGGDEDTHGMDAEKHAGQTNLLKNCGQYAKRSIACSNALRLKIDLMEETSVLIRSLMRW